jgi:hypothetical protein
LGQAGGKAPGEGDYDVANNSPFFTQTEIVDHSGRGDSPGASCQAAPSLDESCVNRAMKIGAKKGTFSPDNNCLTVVKQAIAACTLPSPVQRDATTTSPTHP